MKELTVFTVCNWLEAPRAFAGPFRQALEIHADGTYRLITVDVERGRIVDRAEWSEEPTDLRLFLPTKANH